MSLCCASLRTGKARGSHGRGGKRAPPGREITLPWRVSPSRVNRSQILRALALSDYVLLCSEFFDQCFLQAYLICIRRLCGALCDSENDCLVPLFLWGVYFFVTVPTLFSTLHAPLF